MGKYGLLGAKLSHSFSKDIHKQIADYDYELMEMTEEELDKFLKEKQFKAVNVTIPYKKTVIPYLDEMTDAAKAIGAVNCIRNEEGRLIGHNTDFDGMVGLIRHLGLDLEDKKVMILGTGATSETAYAVCNFLKASQIIKVSRNAKGGSVSYEDASIFHGDTSVIINTTPVGMYPNQFEVPMDISRFAGLEGVVDVVYNPLRTNLILDAMEAGVKAKGGLYMLVEQAVKASEFFLNTKYCSHVTENVFGEMVLQKENVVLTGMPASGKTTIGKMVAERLGRPFFDTDQIIEENAGMPIVEIFEKYGEKHFRDLETEAIKEVSMKTGAVIATGGGAILRKENVKMLKLNGKVFFVDRSLEKLIPTDDRPTASSKEQIKQRYEERYPIYRSTCDHIVHNEKTAGEVAEEIVNNI